MLLVYYLESKTLQSVIYNDMTDLSATILELICESDKDSVTQNRKPVYG